MFAMEYATPDDITAWRRFDTQIAQNELLRKMKDHRCYLLKADQIPVGVLRYNLFWDEIPFLTLIYFAEAARGQGCGRQAMAQWEKEMCVLGYRCVMTSTQADEGAQHFYRKLGYKDTGCLLLDTPPYVQAAELLMMKAL